MAEEVEVAKKLAARQRQEIITEKIRRQAKRQVDEEEKAKAPDLVIRKVSSIVRARAERLFGGRFERGSFSFIVGQGEVGKGVVSSDIIGHLTRGEGFPGENGHRREPIKVLMCVVEDSEEQVAGRLEAAGADLDMVEIITGPKVIRGGLEMTSAMRLDSDAGPLVKHARQEGSGALFIETIVEHFGDRYAEKRISTNSEAEVRSALAPFRAICKEAGLFGWALIHPRKGSAGDPSENISGSAAFYNVPRLTMQVFKDPSDLSPNPRRLLASGKANNLPRRPDTFRFRIEPHERDPDFPKLVWGLEGKTLEDPRTIEEVQQEIEDKRKVRKDVAVQKAETFLQEVIGSGEMIPPDRLKAMAEERGITWRTLEQAKRRLEIVSIRESKLGAKVIGWKFPEAEL